MSVIKDRDIVIVGLQPWDTEIGSNCKDIAIEFSKNNRVLYVNSPLDRITKIRRKDEKSIRKRIDILQGLHSNIELVEPNLWVCYPDVVIESINWIKVNFIFDLLNKFNNRLFANSIRRLISNLGFKDFILFNDNDIFRSFYLKEYLNPDISIYYSRDYLLGVDYWEYHGKRLEPLLMSKSDICVANSGYLASLCRRYNENSYDVGQGCEVSAFIEAAHQPVPSDINGILTPIIGYVGALQSIRLDIDMLEHLATVRPDYQIVLVGPEDTNFKNSDLHKFKNVHFLGAKDPEMLPAYISAFTVCINPQVLNEVTIGNYPRKIDEYLAVGKPVVATKTESMEVFAEYVYLAESKKEFVELIDLSLVEDNSEMKNSRKKFASAHTWEASVRKIYDSIGLKGNEHE